MTLPLFSRLCSGEKFDFSTLANNVEETDQFYEWWWNEQARPGELSRPEIIEDGDPILMLTSTKPSVRLGDFPEFFDDHLAKAIKLHDLPAGDGLPRAAFHEVLVRQLYSSSVQLPDRKQVIFTGGGYGSGKTTTVNYLTSIGWLPVKMGHLTGVDNFKQLIPEYNLIKAVGDGRASLTVQEECYALADELYDSLIEGGRSFVWDSSMSRKESTLSKIAKAEDEGYELTMIAVLTSLDVAIRWAMHRAKISRRFPHPGALPESHTAFRAHFESYVPLFDNILVVHASGPESCYVLAEKIGRVKQLAIKDEPLFRRALSDL